jgi:hypothetical protein
MEEFQQLIRDLYGRYSPETNVDEKIQKFSQARLSPQEFLDGFYKKFDPEKGTDDRKNNIIKTYFARQLKEAEDKELKAKGQYREEDLKTGELLKLQAVDAARGATGSTLQMGKDTVIETAVMINQGIGRFAKQVQIFMDTDEWRSLTGEEKKEAHMGIDILASTIPIGPAGLGTKKVQKESQEFIDKVGMDKIVYKQGLTESIRDSESDTVSEKVDNFFRLGGRAISSGVESLPYTAAAFTGVGQAVLMVGATSRKMNENMELNPEVNSNLLFLNAVGHGGIELADAIITKRLLGGAGAMWGKGASEQAVKKYFEGAASRYLGYAFSVGGEGLTEMAQSTANELWDGFVLGHLGGDEKNRDKINFGSEEFKNFWRKKQWEVYDEGIIGSLTGFGFTAYNAARNSDAKRHSRMVSMLTPLSVRSEQNQNLKKLTDLQKKLDNTTDPNSKKIIKDAMKVLGNKISKASNVSQQVVENFNESQLKEYAKNVDKQNRNLNKIDNKTTPEAKAIIEEQNKELSDINEKMFNEVKEANFGENVKFAKKTGTKLGLDVDVVNSKKSFDNKVKALTGQNIKNESGIEGVFIGGGQILINKETALNQGAISVGSHEVLHPVLNALIGNEAKQKKIVEEFKKELTSKQRKYMDKAMKLKTAKEQYTEYLTVFSDGLRLKKMDYSLTNAESFMKLGKSILNAFKDVGFTNASFKDGKGVYEFMKEYNKSISEGGLTEAASKAIKDAEAKVKVKIKDVKALNKKGQFSRTETSADGLRVNEIYEKTADKTEAGFLIATEYTGQAFSIFESLKQASNYTQDQKNTLENNKEDIISMMLYSQIPDKEEGSKLRNVVGLVQDFNKSQQKYGNLSAYINGFLRERSKEVFKHYVKDAVVESMNDGEGNIKTSVAKKSSNESDIDQGPAARALTDFNDLMINDEKFITSDIYNSIKGKIIKNVTLLLSKGNLDVNNMVEIINKEISNVIKKAQGKISKVDGKVVISNEYNNFVRDGYEGGIKSLPIRVIKDSYLNKLFPTKKLGKVDMQNRKADNQNLKKDSNYRINKLQIGKPTIGNWVKYFTEGGYTTLLAKQKKYATEIAKAVSLKVTRETLKDDVVLAKIVATGSLRNNEITAEIVKGVLETLETTLDTKAAEAAMFDNIQFSRQKLEQEFTRALNADPEVREQMKETWDPAVKKVFEDQLEKPGITSENIAYIGETINLLEEAKIKDFQKPPNIRSKIDGKTVVDQNILEMVEAESKKLIESIPKNIWQKISLAIAGYHFRAVNWSAKKQKSFIDNLKKTEETGEAKELYDKIEIEYLSPQVQGKGLYDEVVLTAQNAKTAKAGQKIVDDAKSKIVKANKANLALLEYLSYKIEKIGLSADYIFTVGQLQTNIQNGFRAYSALSHMVLADGKQFYANSNGKVKAAPKETIPIKPNKDGQYNLPKNAKVSSVSDAGVINIINPNYNKELQVYYNGWKQTVFWKYAFNIAKNGFKDPKTGEILIKPVKSKNINDIYAETVSLLINKNEHLGANALSVARMVARAISKKAIGKANIWADHLTLWAPKFMADIMDALGKKVNRSGENRIMLLPRELQKTIYNVEQGRPSADILIQKAANDASKVSMQKSQSNSDQFNEILEQTKGVDAVKRFSNAAAKSRGAKKGLYDWFIPPSAEDFSGLLYKFLGKGKVGDKQMEFFKEKLMNPFASAMAEIDRRKQKMSNEYLALRKKMPGVKKMLGQNTGYNEFTYDSAVRVYLWNKAGFEIPGLSKRDQTELVKKIEENSDLKLYADNLSVISNINEGWIKPSESWLAGNIPSDISDISQKVNRKEVLAEWVKNKNEIFSKENLNKIEATYGTSFRESLEEILGRMERGSNRPIGANQNKLTTKFMNWVNNSVGAIMFFNARSAILQTISAANFINFKDNNIFAAAAAFANQKQFWSDFTMLFNSDFLKQRRSGLKTDINEAEISNAVGTAPNKATAAFKYMLKKGFLPTQIADSFAIAMGGASFIRNRINSLVKSGMTKQEAMDQAMLDFREISEEAQQSSRPDRISSQQAGPLGRVILAFANTPMQYARMQKKAILDLKNGRGDWKTNMSKILYYGVVQNFIFNALQNALFAMAFDDDEEKLDEKELAIMNGMADSLLRGTGVAGAGVATVKNMVMELIRQNQKARPDYVNVALKSATISPPISSKLNKLVSAARTFQWNGKEIRREGLSLDNPANLAVGKTVSAFTNIPLDRLVQKVDNLKTATEEETAAWQSIALALGWDQWSLGLNPYQKKKSKSSKSNIKFKTGGLNNKKIKFKL